jgi:S1-C subfamily serine protease
MADEQGLDSAHARGAAAPEPDTAAWAAPTFEQADGAAWYDRWAAGARDTDVSAAAVYDHMLEPDQTHTPAPAWPAPAYTPTPADTPDRSADRRGASDDVRHSAAPRRDLGFVALVIAVAVAAAGIGHQVGGAEAERTEVVVRTVNVTGDDIADAVAVYQEAAAFTVQIAVEGTDGGGVGSGVIVSADGEILTNAHVVGAEGGRVRVRLPGESQGRPAEVVARDTVRDLALIRITGTPALATARIAETPAEVGQRVIAVGYALGFSGEPTVTQGIVSATSRSLGELSGLLQTDAAISPGNSGGPVLNAAGYVVGIATAKVTAEAGADNVGFAVPASVVNTFLVEARGGTVVPGSFLGVMLTGGTVGDLGAVVIEVVADSPADNGGVKVGDVIVALDGELVLDPGDLSEKLRRVKPGTTVELEVRRRGQAVELAVVVLERE